MGGWLAERRRRQKNKKKRVQLRGQETGGREGGREGEGRLGGSGSNQPGLVPTTRRAFGDWIKGWMDGWIMEGRREGGVMASLMLR